MVNKKIELEKIAKYKKLILFSLVFLAIFLVVLNKVKKSMQKPTEPTGIVIPTPVILEAGSLSFKKVTDSKNTGNGSSVKLDIVADSNQKYIVGYDVVIQHKKNAIGVLSVESLNPDFDVYSFEKSDHFIITGAKKLTTHRSWQFKNTPILRLTLVPKTTEPITLLIVKKLGPEKTQMVDISTNIQFPRVGSIIL